MLDQILSFIIPNAYADTAVATPQGGGLSFILMLVVFFLFAYFAIWRPQSKRAREQQNLMSSLTKGDEVMSAGGLMGRITKITDLYVGLAVAPNVEITMQKSSIVSVLPKGTLKTLE